MKILVIQTAFVGDVLLSIPSLLRLKSLYPHSELTLLCRKGLSEIFRELKLADIVIELNKRDKSEFKKTFSLLKKTQYDLLICPHQSYRSALMALQIPAKQKIGFKVWWNFFIFDKSTPRVWKTPDALRQLGLIGLVDTETKMKVDSYSGKIPSIGKMGIRERIVKHPRYQSIIDKFNLPKGAVFISPGSVWNTKRWTKSGFKNLARKFTEPVIFIGSPDERDLCTEIATDVPNTINIAGQTSLFELLVLMTTGKFLISNDSGAMHLGSVSELPTVAIFGPTVLSLGYQPWQERATVVENKGLKCRPCGLHGHKKCPIGTHECMTSITSEEVFDALKGL